MQGYVSRAQPERSPPVTSLQQHVYTRARNYLLGIIWYTIPAVGLPRFGALPWVRVAIIYVSKGPFVGPSTCKVSHTGNRPRRAIPPFTSPFEIAPANHTFRAEDW